MESPALSAMSGLVYARSCAKPFVAFRFGRVVELPEYLAQ